MFSCIWIHGSEFASAEELANALKQQSNGQANRNSNRKTNYGYKVKCFVFGLENEERLN
jgi:hypothetical protein